MRRGAWLLAGALCGVGSLPPAFAYTAAGDRTFPATLLLPQGAPSDEAYFDAYSLPQTSSGIGTPSRTTSLSLTYAKTITDRLGISLEESYTRIGRVGAGTLSGWQNLDLELKYLALVDMPHEALLTFGLDRDNGGTGAARVGASSLGATSPRVYFAKGAGDFDIGMWRPLAATGDAGLQFSDGAPRPDLVTGGLAIEYSIPYLVSKVGNFDIAEPFRSMTPITEIAFTMPAGRSYGTRATTVIAPGVSYAGEGWEFAVEALIPLTRAAGRGIGITAQVHVALDFLYPESIGKPLFSAER